MGEAQQSRKNPLQGHGIVPGLRIQVERSVGNRTELFVSQVESVDSDRIAVLVPMARLQRRPLPAGAIVRVSFVHNNRRRRFTSEVLGHSRDGLFDYLRIPAGIEDADRRSSFRLQASLYPTSLFRLVVNGEDEEPREVAINGTVIDISEGGLCFTTRARVDTNERLAIQLDLPQSGQLNARMRVTGTEEPDSRRVNRRVHCAFTNLSRRERDLIARFLMKKQLELRRRGQL